MARPKKQAGERRDDRLSGLRITAAERAHIEAQAARAGLHVSDYARRLLLGHRVAPRRSEADDRLLIELNRVGVNLNQIARALNSDRPERQDLEDALRELRRVLAVAAARIS